jgi:hypothetical protein
VTCPACAEDLPSEGAPRCVHCGERLEDAQEAVSEGFGRDSIAVATLCCVATVVIILLALA